MSIDRVSVASDGTEGDSGSVNSVPSVSQDGRFVAFSSFSTNLVSGDTNAESDIFVHDRVTGITELVSISSDGTQGYRYSQFVSISNDGRFVAFDSPSSTLVDGDFNGTNDVFVHDRVTGITERVSIASDGTQGNLSSFDASISGDGRFVTFTSRANNLVEGDTNSARDIFLHDRMTGTTERISFPISEETDPTPDSGQSSISADGNFIIFISDSKSLVEGYGNSILQNVFVYDRSSGTNEFVAIPFDGTTVFGDISRPSISGDGRYVAFDSAAPNLVSGDTNSVRDVFVHDRETGTTERVSISSTGAQQINGESYGASISDDGRFVTFLSEATNLVPGDTNSTTDVFIHDRVTGFTERLSVADDGTQTFGESFLPSISGDGQIVAFSSLGSNLVVGDTNSSSDYFVVTNPFWEGNGPGPLANASTFELEYFARESAYGRGPLGAITPDDPSANPNLAAFLDGWSVADEFGGNGATFRAIVLEKEGYNPVLAFRGSTDAPDWVQNFDPSGIASSEFLLATNLTGSVSGESLYTFLLNNQSVSMTGHSQGGAQAQLATAIFSEVLARTNDEFSGQLVTFNSPGISSEDAIRYQGGASLIEHFINASDVVSVVGETFIPGELTIYDTSAPLVDSITFLGQPIVFPVVGGMAAYYVHTSHWAQSELIELNVINYSSNPPTILDSPIDQTFFTGDYSPISDYGQDTEYGDVIAFLVGSLYFVAFQDRMLSTLNVFGDEIIDVFGSENVDYYQEITQLSRTTDYQSLLVDLLGAFDTRSGMEALRQDWGLQLAEFINDIGLNQPTAFGLIGGGTTLGLQAIVDLGRLVQSSFVSTAGSLLDFNIAIGNTILNGTATAAELVIGLGDFLIDSAEGALLQTWASANDLEDWISDRITFSPSLTFAEGSHAGTTAAVVLDVSSSNQEMLVSSASNSVFLLTDPGTQVNIASGGNLIWGTQSDFEGANVSGGVIPTDEFFIHGASFGTTDLQLEEGSAIVGVDTNQDGEVDLTITWEGDYRLESIIAEQGVDGTYIRYLGDNPTLGDDESNVLTGDDADDQLYGGAGNDSLNGGAGNDFLFGEEGRDILIDAFGTDWLDGGDEDDLVAAFSGENTLIGGDGNDLLVGGIDSDSIAGGEGNDVLIGDISNFLFGNDRLAGGTGDDMLQGGLGADVFVFARNGGTDTIAQLDIDYDVLSNTTAIGADFQVGIDRVDVSSFGYTSAEEAYSRVSDLDGHATFIDQGTTIVFFDIQTDQLSADNFLFV